MVDLTLSTMPRSSPFAHFRQDLPASVVVLLVAIPLCLGIALGSEAPLFSGIVAGIIGGIVVGVVSGSHLSVSGPAAGLTAIVAAAILSMPSFEAFLLSVVIGGLLQVVFGALRLGVVGDFVPNSVIKGMLAAIGIILILKQVPHLVGYDADFEGDASFLQRDHENTFASLFRSMEAITPVALIIGAFSLGLLVLWETRLIKRSRLLSAVPAPLLVVILGALINGWFQGARPELALYREHLVDLPRIAGLAGLLDELRHPDIAYLGLPAVWVTGVTIALVASLESLLSIEAVDKLDPWKRFTPPNRELVAQGVGNVCCGLLGGIPVTSVIVRSSANVSSGGRTKASAISHGALLLFSVLFIPDLLNRIPLAALAAILIFVGYKLARLELFQEFVRKGWEQFVPFVVTILAILFTDLLIGILIGLVVGIFFVVRSNYRSAVIKVQDGPNHLIRFRRDASFLNKPELKRLFEAVPDNSRLLLDVSKAGFIDRDLLDLVNDFLSQARNRGIVVTVERHPHNPQHELIILPEGRTKP